MPAASSTDLREDAGEARAATLDFVVIGSGRSGTTSLWKHLDSHPDVYTPPDKEQAFFTVARKYERGLDWYMGRMLGSAPAGARCGKVTPAYMAGNDTAIRVVAERIKTTVPEVRLIALLRDPIDRAVATYRSWQRNPHGEPKTAKSFDDSVRVDPGSDELTQRDLVSGGEYGRILKIYLELFPREQLFVGFTSDLEQRPKELMRDLFEFIGVDPEHEPPDLETRYRQGGLKTRVSGEAIDSLITHMRDQVWSSLPDPGREKERGFNWWLRYIWNIEPDEVGKEIDQTTRALLEARYAPDIQVLRDELGVEPPWGRAYEQRTGAPAAGRTEPSGEVKTRKAPEAPAHPGIASPVEEPASKAAAERPLPNFLIIGAQKSATRWLRRNLGKHPEIFTADRECSYFSSDRFEHGLDWYRSQFEDWDGERLVGEATPAYMMWRSAPPSTAEVAARIEALPTEMKLVAVLRNPVDRAYSAFIHHMLHNRIAPDEDLLERVRQKPPKESEPRIVMGGMYGESLAPFHERFGDRLRVFIQEDAKRDPHALYREVLEHLGADAEFAPEDLDKLVGSYKPPETSPYALEDGSRRPLRSEEREALFSYFEDDVARLEGMIGRDLSVWRP